MFTKKDSYLHWTSLPYTCIILSKKSYCSLDYFVCGFQLTFEVANVIFYINQVNLPDSSCVSMENFEEELKVYRFLKHSTNIYLRKLNAWNTIDSGILLNVNRTLSKPLRPRAALMKHVTFVMYLESILKHSIFGRVIE